MRGWSVRLDTGEVQVVGGVDDNSHQGEVESSHLGSDLRFDAAMIEVMGTQQAVDGVDGLSLDLPPARRQESSG